MAALSTTQLTSQQQQVDKKYVDYFNRADINGREIGQGMAELVGQDRLPEPTVVAAALRACRRVDDFSLATRILEAVKLQCGQVEGEGEMWPWLVQQIGPTLAQLGIPPSAHAELV